MNPDILRRARALLEDATPLRTDCGLLCAHACCLPDEDGQGGVYLFPGEKPLTGDWGEIVPEEILPGVPADMLICRGACDRRLRPLACRIFPLTPYVKTAPDGTEKLTVRMDVRARPLCPLYDSGMAGLNPTFVAAVKQALRILWDNETHREYLRVLTAHLDEYQWL